MLEEIENLSFEPIYYIKIQLKHYRDYTSAVLFMDKIKFQCIEDVNLLESEYQVLFKGKDIDSWKMMDKKLLDWYQSHTIKRT